MGYSILLWDRWGQGKVRVNARLYTEGYDAFGFLRNWFQFDQLTDEEIIEKHNLARFNHFEILR